MNEEMTKAKIKNTASPPEGGTSTGQEIGNANFDELDLKIASDCALILKDWAKGQRFAYINDFVMKLL
jgi:hypothetical protein